MSKKSFRYPSLRHARRGAVMMEYVVIAVLIAAACVCGVLVVSRSIARGWGVSARGTTLDHTAAAEKRAASQDAVENDAKVAEDYHDTMHK
jgi:Flp pilus assembly pilin Flp